MLTSIRRWFEQRTSTSTLSNPASWLREAFGAEETYSGQSITAETAMRSTAVLACIRVLSEGVAGLPLQLYRRTGEGRDLAPQHPSYRVLHRIPNSRQTSFEYRQLCMVHVLLFGNAFSEIVRDPSGNVAELWPIHPSLVTVKADSFEIYANGQRTELPWADVLHLKGLSTDGRVGLSPIQAAKQSIGLGLAAERFGATYFGSGSRVGGVLNIPGHLNPEQTAALHAAWNRRHAGPDHQHDIAVLHGDMKFEPFRINNEESQWLDSRRFGVEDICRIYRVPPHMAGDLSKANYSNVDALDRAFVQHSLMPYLIAQEQAFTMRLLSEPDQETYYVEHDAGGLLRGDPESQMRSFQAAIYAGIFSPNDARKKLNLNPREGGDIYLQPTNLAPSPFAPAQTQQTQGVQQ